MYRTLTIILCSLCTCSLFSQKNFVDAHITARDGRSHVGEIDYREWSVNPEVIRFRTSAEAPIREMGVREVESFQIYENDEKYLRAEISIINESIEFDQLPFFRNVFLIDSEIPRVEATVFLRVLAEGAVNLYQLIDRNKRLHYYIQRDDGPIEELTYRVVKLFEEVDNLLGPYMRRTENPGIIYLETYKEQLFKAMATGCPELEGAIGQVPYSNLIQNLIVRYNECVGDSRFIKEKERSYHAFYVQGGLLHAGFSVNDQNNPEVVDMNRDRSFYFGGGYEFAVPRSRDKFLLGLEMNFFSSKSDAYHDFLVTEGALRTIQYNLDQRAAQFNIYGKFIPFQVKYAPYLKAGIGIFRYWRNSFNVQDNQPGNHDFDRHSLKKAEMTSLLAFGIKSKSLFTEFRYGSGTDINPTTGYDLSVNRWSLVLGMHLKFGKQQVE